MKRSAAELYEQLQSQGETERIEAKRCSEVGHSVLETVCAFANEPQMGGGWLLLGVEQDSNTLFDNYTYKVTGVTDPDKISSELASQCRSAFNTSIAVNITTETLNDKHVIVVFVPEAEPATKPVYFTNKGLPGGAMRRIGPTDVKCADDDLQVFYQERQGTFDAGILKDASMKDIDLDAVEDYRKERRKVNPLAEELEWSDVDLLHALGGVRYENDTAYPTVAGILLFGTKMALRRLFPMVRVDYIRVPGKEWVADPEKRYEAIEMRDPIMRLTRRAEAAIAEDLVSSFSLPPGQLQREPGSLVNPRVWREALVNALMHRSYRKDSPVMIIRYANRLEVRNAGYSLKSLEHLNQPESRVRNPKIAAVLHEIRFAETKGTGIRVMRRDMEAAGLTPPLFESSRETDNFVATFFFHHFLSDADRDWLIQHKAHALTDDEARALVFVRENGAIDNTAYRNLNQTDTLSASKHLAKLRDCGLLTQKGKGSATHYIKGQDWIQTSWQEEAPIEPSLSEGLVFKTEGVAPKTEELGSKTEELNLKTEELSPKTEEIPEQLREKIALLKGRSSRKDVETVIIDLCRWRTCTLHEIAKYLNRQPSHIRTYIMDLVRRGHLMRTHPDKPTAHKQAYYAPKNESSKV